MATTPPTPRTHQPLPAPRSRSTMDITNYGWSTSRCCAVALRLAGRRSALLLAENHSLTWLAEQTRTLNFAAWAACGRPGYHRLRVAPAGSCRAEQHDDKTRQDPTQ
jgi:hypothetical protein